MWLQYVVEEDDGVDMASNEEAESGYEAEPEQPNKKLSVSAGVHEKVDYNKLQQKQKAEEKRLAEMMIPKKNKRLYNKIMYSKRKKPRRWLQYLVICWD
ncbi:hypothetical protein EB796_004119 [Bugula neritina]|uniref:Uncharacterized protein n=1 Tax=Bugula neritina TaxID=10212 RepID=A0A7J7KG44_BUGNE|nr:hypothetical protein EB796_004119 [Bugula neritina]